MMTIPMGLVVWLSEHVVSRSGPPLRQLPAYGAVSLVTSLFFCVAVAGLRGARAAARPSAVETAPPRFLDRLPLKLRGAEVWAVEAEDHYLRLHTSRGQDLILMRLADAVAELEGDRGHAGPPLLVDRPGRHRRRQAWRRPRLLTLKDRSEVPVSRTYAGQLRDKGWI
jgi:DNA-binding LytR/AlgR family response regulator